MKTVARASQFLIQDPGVRFKCFHPQLNPRSSLTRHTLTIDILRNKIVLDKTRLLNFLKPVFVFKTDYLAHEDMELILE